MTPRDFLTEIILRGLERLSMLGGPVNTPDAQRVLLAIALQESGPTLSARYQNYPATSPGPARGFWQFEQNGGVAGVLQHNSTKALARTLCNSCVVLDSNAAVWRSLEGHDDLATGFARLLLLTDPAPLPVDETGGWDCYLRNWRPGRPFVEKWADNWTAANRAVRESLVG